MLLTAQSEVQKKQMKVNDYDIIGVMLVTLNGWFVQVSLRQSDINACIEREVRKSYVVTEKAMLGTASSVMNIAIRLARFLELEITALNGRALSQRCQDG
jgi:uridylate kinase